MKTEYQLAQINIAVMKAPLEHPIMEGFVARLDEINALAERSAGFVWRLQSDDGDATAIRAYEDPRVLVNMSVWESLEALHRYVYSSAHLELLRDKRGWFEPPQEAHLALWWTPVGEIPSVDEGVARLETLRKLGSSPRAFTFRQPFPEPGGDVATGSDAGLDECPWGE